MGCITCKPENTGYQYILAYRFPDGEAKNMIMELSKLIGGQVYNGYKARNESPHFTLKYVFVAKEKQLNELINSLEQFAKNNKPAIGIIVLVPAFHKTSISPSNNEYSRTIGTRTKSRKQTTKPKRINRKRCVLYKSQ